MSGLDRKIECGLVDRAVRIASDGKLWDHFREVLGSLGIDADKNAMDAMLAGAIDAMLFDDATENRSRDPFIWGSHDWRKDFFKKHWSEIRPE